ncbi:hypothetical protein [Sulfurimonas sp.]|uniref:hypothetical protein n=1 Tax=Sulfurimonas sp. TaxID=2022749 RepID=UPI002617696B|nr:hypothetical protein [Sulfurimonas sp.]MCW8895530.1 hypothetical protein [Sulfurimonas sp.]MCW9067992.1 hypothetical protein [Sulfurimonas sp.]
MANLNQFLDLFNPLPGNHYLQVTTSPDETTHAMCKMLNDVSGELALVVYSEEEVDYSDEFPDAKLQYVKDFKEPFRAIPRNHDIVVFKDIFHLHENKNMILKIAYTTLANTANIIIMQKKGTMDIEAIKEMLEEFEFRAPNEIDVLPEYDLVIAKKMHMWGNGL